MNTLESGKLKIPWQSSSPKIHRKVGRKVCFPHEAWESPITDGPRSYFTLYRVATGKPFGDTKGHASHK